MVTVDFETAAIEARPKYPPEPVGVAIKLGAEQSKYFAWGHPSGNNCTRAEAMAALDACWNGGEPVLFHNAKFDMDVAETHCGMPRLPWDRMHDTMFLAFLSDPHSSTISLKPLAERYLSAPPTERDEVYEWLRSHGVITAAQKSPGAFIAQCDGEVVARYACGDVDRTHKLFGVLHDKVSVGGMSVAYDRERQLLPILLDNERRGIRVDVERMGIDLPLYEKSLSHVESWLRNATKTPSLNFDADAEVADALHRCGAVTEWKLTPTGRRSTSKKNLVISNVPIATALNYRNRLQNLLSQSLRPWYEQAKANRSHIFTEWNQVRTARGSDVAGTRTGRLSCARFMNIAKSNGGLAHPSFIRGCEPLPLVRQYLLPDEGGVWVHRDYNQQEFRILAHYENGKILEAYQRKPRTDYHTLMHDRVLKVAGLDVERQKAKIANFLLLYGGGVARLSEALKVSTAEATVIRDGLRKATPDVQALDRELKRRGREGEPVRTWGGRLYYCEPPSDDGRTFDYKMLNYLIQGSAADCTKEAIIQWNEAKFYARLLVSVHDEINISAAKGTEFVESEKLREVMEGVVFDVPMLTDEKRGLSWGALEGVK